MAAKALRNIPKLMGLEYATGAAIPDEVIAKMTPQAVRALVNNGVIEVDGMDATGGGGVGAHLKAKVDSHHDRLGRLETANKTLQASNDDLVKRLATLEGAAGVKPISRRAARQVKE